MRYDFFISHASEDKETVARPLAEALKAYDLSVFLDSWEILPGDNLQRELDKALSGSRCGLVVISQAFPRKHYTLLELDALLALEQDGTRIVPILHQVDALWFRQQFPAFARKVWLRADAGIEDLAASLYDLAVRRWDHQALQLPGEYRETIPVREQMFDDATEWIEMLLNPEVWHHFEARRDVSRGNEWMGSNDELLIEAGFRIYLPVLIAGGYRKVLERNRTTLSPPYRRIAQVLEVARDALVREDRLAVDFGTRIAYSPREKHWRRLRETDPARYLWQGLSIDRLQECAAIMERRLGALLVDAELADWMRVYEDIYETRGEGYQPLGLVYNSLYRFTPATRPVFVRLLTVWRALYAAALVEATETAEGGTPRPQSYVAQGLERMRELLGRLDGSELYEAPDKTVDAARGYLAAHAPRDLRVA